ncbi:MAG: hypothetical protein KI793_22990 [Rivularia sp. (in: Bacteria)]|nr:hypothetical protein [Rivularia sp. MS3]
MNYCPCCKDTLLSHISHNHVYWFCPSCWQEMPVRASSNSDSLTAAISKKLSRNFQQRENSLSRQSQSFNSDSELAVSSV